MGFFVLKIKRTWLLSALFVIALGLNSCANSVTPYSGTGGAGYGTCSGSLGTFNVTLQPTSDNYTYVLILNPTSGYTPGDIVSVYIANGSKGYVEVVNETVINSGEVITAGPITSDQLNQYDVLAIVPFSPNTDFLNGDASADTYCYIPQPGQTTN